MLRSLTIFFFLLSSQTCWSPRCWEQTSQGCFSSFYTGYENDLVSVLDIAPLVHLKELWKGSQVVHCYQLHMDSEAFL